MALFPEAMAASLTLEGVAAKLSSFYDQVHLIHWESRIGPQHEALGDLYSKLIDYKDEIVEKLMGYMGRRVKAYKIEPLKDGVDPIAYVKGIVTFAKQLEEWAEENEYCDIENIAQSLSGDAAKILYRLTMS